MNHNMERLTSPPGTAGEWLTLSECIPSGISALRCCLRRFTLNAARPADAVGHQRIQLSR